MNERSDARTNKSPPVFYRTSFPLGPLPKNGKMYVRSESSMVRKKEERKEGRKKDRREVRKGRNGENRGRKQGR